MNYLKEINAFYDTIERYPLSSSAVTLWHALMHINNKARWSEQFTVAAVVLQYKSGLTDSSFKRARKQLTQKGYISFESRDRNRAPVYQITSLVRDSDNPKPQTPTDDPSVDPRQDTPEPDPEPVPDPPADPATAPQTTHEMAHFATHLPDQQTDHYPAPLTKPNDTNTQKTKPISNEPATDAIAFYQTHFGTATPFITEAIRHWTSDLSEDLIIHAMKRTLEQGKTHWGYVKGILKSWTAKGIRTITAADADDTRHRQQTAAIQYNNHAYRRQDIVPDWFKELKRPSTAEQPARAKKSASFDPETRALLDAFLQKQP